MTAPLDPRTLARNADAPLAVVRYLFAAAGRAIVDCEKCGDPFEITHHRGKPKRFCSETCRKAAERARARERAKVQKC